MNKKTLAALGAFVVLAILALVALRQPEKGERASDHPHPIPALKTAEITSIDVTKNGVTTTVKSEGGNYKVTAPVAYPADSGAAKAAFDGLGKMDVSDLVTQQPDKQAEFEVDDKSGVHVVVKHDATVLADLIVGKGVGAGTMIRPAGSNDVWRASGITKFLFDKGPSDWRDKGIVTYLAADVEKLDVAAKDGAKISLKKAGTKQGSEDKWAVASSTVKIDTLDNGVPNAMVQALSNWKTNDFADGVTLAAAGLEPPALTVTVGLKGGRSVIIFVGGKKGEDELYVKKADAPQVFLVKKYGADKVNKAPIEFRDKTLCDLAADDVAGIAVSAGDRSYTLVKSGSEWKATKPAKLELDGAKATPIAGAFKELKGTAFADDQSLKDNGLAKPKLIAVKGKGKGAAAGCAIRVGDETKDKVSYFVASGKGTDVYLAPKWSLDRILVKPDDLKKSGGATTAATRPAKPTAKLAAKK
jgi:Domain of unknown function (DUF4340)